MKILLVRNDNLGDLICTTPAIEALRKKYPDATIDIVVNSYNFLGIRNNPFVDNIFVYTKPKHVMKFKKIQALFGKINIMKNIFFKSYDVSVVFRMGYSSSAEQFSKLSKALMRIGVKSNNGKDNFTHHVISKPDSHEVEFCFDCLKPLDVEYKGEKTFFYIEDEYVEKFKRYEGEVLFHISARMKPNQMSFEKLKKIFNKLNMKIFITADPKDWEMAKNLENENVKFIKTNNFLEWAGVIKNARFFITLEGGAMHLAPALGVKTMALFGKSDINRWHPWGYKDLVLQDKSRIAENINNNLIVEKIKENL